MSDAAVTAEMPIVVVGAGPVGLAAAAQLLERDQELLILERGPGAGAAVAEWNHVRLFSPWSELVDEAAARLLATTGWSAPKPDAYPTGQEWVAEYLAPLAGALGHRVRFGTEVVGVARRGRDRAVDAGRADEPLTVLVRDGAGEQRFTARALIDASGTWRSPNPLGGDGLPAVGESSAVGQISYRVPDFNHESERYSGRHTVVTGSGHSALTALIALTNLAEKHPGTRITWAVRRGAIDEAFGGGEDDALPARAALGEQARTGVTSGHVNVVRGFRTSTVERDDAGRLALVSEDGRRIEDVDEVVALTGFRPELSWLSEVRLDLDPVLQAPVKLAPLIDPNIHSCGTVPPHGAAVLSHPEPGVYLAGMKSYGRAPTFLALTGYEQVRSIAAELAGDAESAARVELSLPATGVCGGAGLFDDASAGGGCYGGPAVAAPDVPEGAVVMPLLGVVGSR